MKKVMSDSAYKITVKPDEAFKMNAHHVPLKQSVEEITLGKE